MNIYLVRHGQTDWNKVKKLQGRKDIPMNSEGIKQITKIGNDIVAKGITIDLIVTSPLERARLSADIIAKCLDYDKNKIVCDEDFIERDFGQVEGTILQGLLDKEDEIKYGIEPIDEMRNRSIDGVNKYIDQESILIVSHGAILKALIVELSKGDIEYFDWSINLHQGDVFYIKYENSRIIEFNQRFLYNDIKE